MRSIGPKDLSKAKPISDFLPSFLWERWTLYFVYSICKRRVIRDENEKSSTEAAKRLEKGYAKHRSKGLEQSETNLGSPTILPLRKDGPYITFTVYVNAS